MKDSKRLRETQGSPPRRVTGSVWELQENCLCFPCLSFPRWKMRKCFGGGGEASMPSWVFSVLRAREGHKRRACRGSGDRADSLPALLRGKTCPVLKGTSHWPDITLASRIFSSLRGRLPSLEGGETGRRCLWQMELTFSALASYVSLYSSQNHGLAFPQGTQGLSYAGSSHPHCKEPTCIALLCNQHCY